MKRHLSLILTATTILLQFSLQAQNQVKKTEANTIIKSVTVFASGARIERTGKINLSPGRTEISFKGLSNQLDQQSVQLMANENITLLSVQTAKDYLSARKTDQQEKVFIDSINNLQNQLELNQKMLGVYKNEEDMLNKNEAIGGTSGVKTTELKEALDLHRQRLTEIYKQELELQNKIRMQEDRLKTMTEQLAQFSRKKDSVNNTVTALVETKSPVQAEFRLLYNVKDAGWYPSYDVRVKDISNPLDFLMNANVFQRSGETWKDVSLALSTGNPAENATPTDLQPWRLDYYNPSAVIRGQIQYSVVSGRVTNEDGEPIAFATVIVKGTKNGSASDGNGFFRLTNVPGTVTVQVSAVGYQSLDKTINSGYTAIVLQKTANQLQEVVVTAYGVAGNVAGVQINQGNDKLKKEIKSIQPVDINTEFQPTTIVYNIGQKYTIETDGKTSTIGIRNIEIPSGYQYFTAPKVDPSAFLTALIPDWQSFDLQPGEANLYFEGNFLGKTYLDLTHAGDTLSLSLGKDNGVQVTRKLVKEFSSKKFIGSNKSESRKYEITVRNNKNQPVKIKVEDQFPVSVTKEIGVSDAKAPGAEVDDNTGIITWNIELAPKEERKLEMSFTVKYPKGRQVVLE